jgi:hypothetical protein
MIAMISILLIDRVEHYFAGILDITLFVTNKIVLIK